MMKEFFEKISYGWYIAGGCIILITIILYFLLHPTYYTAEVKTIQWEYNVHIEEFVVEHHTNERSKPSDAYNVDKHHHTHTKTYTDSDGKTHTKTETETRYDYDVNRWKETRRVQKTGYDHEPYYGEYTLKETNDPDGIGAERVGHYSEIYTAQCLLLNSDDTNLKDIVISRSIWDRLKIGDQLNFKESRARDPYEITIAE